jgi:alcohol oxidase
VIRNHRAVGVEYTNDPVTNPDGGSEVHITLASKLVVVSAGAFGSPAILERSGIGAKAVLERCGVEQTVDLPGVGENYQGACRGTKMLTDTCIITIIRRP